MKQHGFTLIEIMVALMIFTILSVIIAGSLRHVLASNQHIIARQKILNQLLKTEYFMRMDMSQIVDKQTPTQIDGKTFPVKSIENGIDFMRTGVINPDGYYPRDDFAEVQYVLQSHRLLRIVNKHSQTLLEHVTGFKIRYYNRDLHDYAQWPLPYRANAAVNNQSPLPVAVAVTIQVKHQGEWYWIFPTVNQVQP